MNIAWYATAHGHGHAARSCDIIRALLAREPETRVTVIGRVSDAFLRSRLPMDRVTAREAVFDVGLVQRDSISGDLDATREAALALAARRSMLVEQETAFLRAGGFDRVVVDIPAIPLEAAARLGLPRFAVGNFSWNWIYEELAPGDPRWAPIVSMYREGYAAADLLLRLPFHEEMEAFPRRRDVPVVAGMGRNRREEIARAANAPVEARWALLCFANVNWDESALQRLERIENTIFLTLRPLEWKRRNFRALDRLRFPFTDALASADVVLTKPGHGIISECAANDKPMACVERPDFPEARVLIPAIRRHLRYGVIELEAFYRGEIEAALAAALNAPPPLEPAPLGGAPLAAEIIAG